MEVGYNLFLFFSDGMGILALLSLMVHYIPAATAATHSLRYFYTAIPAVKDFPEYTAVGMVDDGQFVYYDSNIKRMIPKTEWIKQNEGADYWDQETQTQIHTQFVFNNSVGTLIQRFNQTQGLHTLQEMYGCEWDDESGATDGFIQFGYDGADLVVFDMKNMRWIAPTPQGVATKKKWDKDRAFNERRKNYLTQECIGWLKKYVSYGRSTLERRVHPEVSLFQKDSSSPVVCHATGFFPCGIMVTWQRDGEEVQEDVEQGETLPNGDGTFQITSRLTVKPGDWKTHTYTCTVQHKSLQNDIIKTHSFSSGPPIGIIISCVVVGLLLALIGVFMCKKRSTDFPEFVDVEMWEYEAMSNKKQTEEYLDRLYWEQVKLDEEAFICKLSKR